MQRTLPALFLLLLTYYASAQTAKIETAFSNSLEMPFVRVASIGALVCRYETRVKDYQPFATATNLEWKQPEFPQTPDHPAINVSFTDALAFCEWLGKREGRKYRLLTDQEWSVLAGLQEKTEIAPNQQPPSTGIHHWGKGSLSKKLATFAMKLLAKSTTTATTPSGWKWTTAIQIPRPWAATPPMPMVSTTSPATSGNGWMAGMTHLTTPSASSAAVPSALEVKNAYWLHSADQTRTTSTSTALGFGLCVRRSNRLRTSIRSTLPYVRQVEGKSGHL